MSGSQFQQFNEDLNKMLGSTQMVSIMYQLLLCMLKFALSPYCSCQPLPIKYPTMSKTVSWKLLEITHLSLWGVVTKGMCYHAWLVLVLVYLCGIHRTCEGLSICMGPKGQIFGSRHLHLS